MKIQKQIEQKRHDSAFSIAITRRAISCLSVLDRNDSKRRNSAAYRALLSLPRLARRAAAAYREERSLSDTALMPLLLQRVALKPDQELLGACLSLGLARCFATTHNVLLKPDIEAFEARFPAPAIAAGLALARFLRGSPARNLACEPGVNCNIENIDNHQILMDGSAQICHWALRQSESQGGWIIEILLGVTDLDRNIILNTTSWANDQIIENAFGLNIVN
jgi:hypothetical protein